MFRKVIVRRAMVLLGVIMSFALMAPDADAQEAVQEQPQDTAQGEARPAPEALLNTSGRVRFEIEGFIGYGIEHNDIGVTTSGDDITISAGGGIGAAMTLGYGISSRVDLDLTLGWQVSSLWPAVKNADGEFTRNFQLATLKYKIPISSQAQLKIGAGIGTYRSGKLDVSATNHEVVHYDDASGFHLTGEIEAALSDTMFVTAGGKLYFVTYDARTYTVNGVPTPLTSLNNDFRDFNGSGFDMHVGIGFYF